jgi:hypothetical protein
MNIVLNIPAWAQNEIKLDCPSENEGIIGTTFCNKFYTHTIPATWPKEPGFWSFGSESAQQKWKANVQKLTDECCAQLESKIKNDGLDPYDDQCLFNFSSKIYADNDTSTSYQCELHSSGEHCLMKRHKMNQNDFETRVVSQCLPSSYPKGGKPIVCKKQETIYTTQEYHLSCIRESVFNRIKEEQELNRIGY